MTERSKVPFNFETAFGSKERVDWLRENHDKPITLEEYVAHIKSLPHNHPKAAKCRSHAKGDYKYLVARFGFFGGST